MSEAYRVEPDLEFISDLRRSGGDTLRKCFQCATCSVVCPLSPAKDPFPRKEMIQAQWGLKEKLVRDPDIWLCHNCNDCSTYCPRGAKPGDVLNALRKKSIEHYSVPSSLARMVADRKHLLSLFIPPLILFLVVVLFTNHFGDSKVLFHGKEIDISTRIVSWKMIPMLAVDVIFISTALFAAAVFAQGAIRFWRDMDAARPRLKGIVPSAIEVLKDILNHRNFKECGTNKERYLGHLGIFYGFVALFVVTTCIFLGIYFLSLVVHIAPTPWPLWNPVKILANFGAIALLAGCAISIRKRLVETKDSSTGYFDWFLLVIITIVGASGLLAEITRLLGIGILFYTLYYVHLVAVWSLFAYAPYSKLAHLVYRTLALIHAKASGRELTLKAQVTRLSA